MKIMKWSKRTLGKMSYKKKFQKRYSHTTNNLKSDRNPRLITFFDML